MMQTNQQLELAHRIIRETNSNLFLTGKAGTGKTTFLKRLREVSPKRMVVVAPTGVAAINAGGVTIHSFFQIPFGPYLPGQKDLSKEVSKMRREKINIIRTLDLLVIDEVSMVRADLLDCIDDVLRRVRRSSLPFGGLQLLMIGDTQQLTPVVKDEEWAMLGNVYDTPYFFSSLALRETAFSCVELKHIFRQEDESFISLLNKIRENNVDRETLDELNKRYLPDFNPDDSEGYIRLTTHNVVAQDVNDKKLSALKSEAHVFKAKIEGNFPEYSFPTDGELVLKENAQVMFIKNDSSSEKRYFNGKIGVVKSIDGDEIVVEDRKTGALITVDREVWENMRYELNKETNEIEEKVDGVFEQYPLKTAWAITIHKSQGLTFDRAIIDAAASFSHGQVYVALSRCRRLEGMVLSSPLSFSSIRHDNRVDLFNQDAENRVPDDEAIDKMHRDYFLRLAVEQFSFDQLSLPLHSFQRLLVDSFAKLYPGVLSCVDKSVAAFKDRVESVSHKFVPLVGQLVSQSQNVDGDEVIKERTQKASSYFLKECETIVAPVLDALAQVQTDNKDLAKRFNDLLVSLQNEYDKKIATLSACAPGFSSKVYLKVRNDALVAEKTDVAKRRDKVSSDTADILHPELYQRLRDWRKEEAEAQKVPSYVVLSQMALINIVNMLPSNDAELLKVKGVGKMTAQRYGAAILSMVDECAVQYEYKHERSLFDAVADVPKKEKPAKGASCAATLQLFNEGKGIKEIAETRGLAESTVESHLLQCVKDGTLSPDALCGKERLAEIAAFVSEHPQKSAGDLHTLCDGKYSWTEIRLALYIGENSIRENI